MTSNQRWREGRDRYRPAGETIRTSEYEVAVILDNTTARAFVEQHHYSRSYPAARFRFGIYHRGSLVGVAVFSTPITDRVLAVFPGPPRESIELGRFVLLDEAPGNGETWFLGRCFELLRRQGLRGVVAFADPVPRRTGAGQVVFPGHLGTIYQAHNARYLGRGTPRTLRLFQEDGTVFSERALSKLRCRIRNLRARQADTLALRRERGWRYAAATLVARGADTPPDQDASALESWLRHWLTALTVPLRHPGNHRYAWTLDRRSRVQLPGGNPFPKLREQEARLT